MAQIQPFILEPEYSSEEEFLEDEVDELDLPVNVNAGRLRNSSWCKCGELVAKCRLKWNVFAAGK